MNVNVGCLLITLLCTTASAFGQNLTISLNPSSPTPNDFQFVIPMNAGTPLGDYTNSSMQMNYMGHNKKQSIITVRKTAASLHPGVEIWVWTGLPTGDPNNPAFGLNTDPVLVTTQPQIIVHSIQTPSNTPNKIRNVYVQIKAVDYSLLTADRYNVSLVFEHILTENFN